MKKHHELKENNLVTQSNFLIRGKNKDPLTITEQKILFSVISMIQPTDDDFVEYRLDARELFNLIGVGSNTSTAVLKDTAEKLVGRAIELPNVNGDNNWTFVALLSSCQYVSFECELRITISPKLKPFLLQLKESFTSYQLFQILKLKRSYSITLYQILKSYEYKGRYKVSVERLKELLGADLIKSYGVYSVFKNKLLLHTIEEINEKTDIYVVFSEIRKGRRVVELDFSVLENKKNINDVLDKDIRKNLGKVKTIESPLVKILIEENIEINSDFIKTENTWWKYAEKIWGEDKEDMLLKVVRFLLSERDIKNPLGFITSKLQTYADNVSKGYNWNYGDREAETSQLVPSWFYNNNEVGNEVSNDVDEEELEVRREKLREMLKDTARRREEKK